ncbi:MAG: nuclear transport factor 2 family protein [Gemmatimonadales bacterium]
MRSHVCAVVAPLLLAPLLPTHALAQAGDVSPVAVVHAFHQAVTAGDSVRALALLLPDLVVFEAGAVEASRDEYRASHLSADMAFAQATRREVLSERTGTAGDVAWVLTESRATGTFRGRPVDSRGVETMILRRTPEGWRIAHIHWSSRRG